MVKVGIVSVLYESQAVLDNGFPLTPWAQSWLSISYDRGLLPQNLVAEHSRLRSRDPI